jgi:hypothetical protein
VQATGRRALALLDFSTAGPAVPRVLLDEAGADYTGPRWSPDGRRIVAERRRMGVYELVLIDPETRGIRTLAARRDARLVTPSWTPDGATILFSAAPDELPFNVFALDVASGDVRGVTDTVGGAQFPELSSQGALTYVGYTADGYDLFSVPFALNPEATGRTWTTGGSPAQSRENSQNQVDLPYRPWRTLVPTFWTPIIQSDAGETVIGAGTAMVDALGRHAYAVDAGWAAARARPDWHAAYAYGRWRPTLFVTYADDTDPVRGGTIRSRELFAGALLPFHHLRWSETLLAGFDSETDTFTCTAISRTCRTRDRALRSVRGGWLHDSRRLFGYSISPEEGFVIEAAAETSRAALGSDVDAGAALFDARMYHRLFGRHTVFAGRFAVAAGWGGAGARRLFSAGGSGPSYPVFHFSRDTVGLLRGFAPQDIVGSRVTVASLDVRFPLARRQRGAGAWPVFLRTLHGAVFADAGHAWDTTFSAADLRTSTGGELSLDIVILHSVPLTLVSGAAWIRDPVANRRGATGFGRIGYAF